MTTPFQAPPADLVALKTYLRRAHETKKADPALSYWCNYHAAQIGIPLHASIQPSSKIFLMQLLDTLEAQKKSLSDNEIVNGDEIVAKAYVENAALRAFVNADREDQSGNITKATAGRYLAAADFFEVLNNFGPLENNVRSDLLHCEISC